MNKYKEEVYTEGDGTVTTQKIIETYIESEIEDITKHQGEGDEDLRE